MEKEEALLIKRLQELSDRSYSREIYTYSDFLNMYEQDLLLSNVTGDYILFGGIDSAERKIACFGNEDTFRYSPSYPICCIMISPLMQKFADSLTHRDFLGSVLALGIKREMLGDIIIKENEGYIFCLFAVAEFITENLNKVKHTSVKCAVINELPENINPEYTEKVIVVASQRLDAVIGAVYNISRNDSNSLFTAKKVFVNNKLTESNSHKIKENDIISVRGFGRFKWRGMLQETRKGKLRALVEVF